MRVSEPGISPGGPARYLGTCMLIDLRDIRRQPVGRVDVDPDARPTRVQAIARDGTTREAFLQWDGAIDDSGHVRRCVACGGSDLFHEKAFPLLTGFVVVLAFAGSVVGLLGFASGRPGVMAALALVLTIDIAIFAFSRRRLVCYRCLTSYPRPRLARYHRAWDRSIAGRNPAPAGEHASASVPRAAAQTA